MSEQLFRVYVSLGSNVNAAANICSGMRHLKHQFTEIVSSTVYQTAAVGFEGDDFLNSVVGLSTELSIDELRACLRGIEDSHGRKRSTTEKFNSRTLDIDLLLYDDVVTQHERYKLPHDDILKYAFVLYPLAEVAPELKHPILGQPIQQIAQNSELEAQSMLKVVLDCSHIDSQ